MCDGEGFTETGVMGKEAEKLRREVYRRHTSPYRDQCSRPASGGHMFKGLSQSAVYCHCVKFTWLGWIAAAKQVLLAF